MSNKKRQKNILFVIAVIIAISFSVYLVSSLNLDFGSNQIGDSTSDQYEEVLKDFDGSNYLFVDEISGLSFNYPDEFSYYTVENEIGYSIVMEDDDAKRGFQINVLPWDEGEGRLTKNRIQKDLPSLVIKKFGEADLEIKSGILEAVTFITPDDNFDDLREVWFIKGEYLYQFSLPTDAEKLINIILGTLDFK